MFISSFIFPSRKAKSDIAWLVHHTGVGLVVEISIEAGVDRLNPL